MSDPVVEVTQSGRQPLFVLVKEHLEVGRECDGLLLADGEVSRRHARLDHVGGGALSVTDLGSTNGTTLNGTPVTAPTPVGPGDVVRLGTTELRLVVDRTTTPTPPPAGEARGTVVSGRAAAGDAVTAVRPIGGGDGGGRATSIMAVAAAVQEDRPQVGHANADGDTVTIVFSDIESSTERALALGDGRWFDVLQEHNRIVRTNLRHFGGTEIKSQGDGFMLTFQSARRAVQFCTAVQQELAAWARKHPDDAVRIRIGLHTGEAIVDDDGDLFGKHIIVAARIANLADGGQILVSNVVKEITSSRGDLRFGEPVEVTLKGIEGPQPVYEVLWED